MYGPSPFLEAELNYRAARLKARGTGRRRTHVRVPWVRRPAEASDNAR